MHRLYLASEDITTLAKLLEGTTDEVVVSFAQLYKKTTRNMEDAAHEYGFTWEDHKSWESSQGERPQTFSRLGRGSTIIRHESGICSQKEFIVGVL